MSLMTIFMKRGISTSAVREGKRNFRKFLLYNKRGTKIFKQQQMENPDPDVPIHKRGLRDVGYEFGGKFVTVPEMIPELIVPNLSDFKLKPYVSYRTPEVVQSEFTAEDLFSVIYAPKIAKDFKDGKLKEDGSPVSPTPEESLTAEEAKLLARKTGSDMF